MHITYRVELCELAKYILKWWIVANFTFKNRFSQATLYFVHVISCMFLFLLWRRTSGLNKRFMVFKYIMKATLNINRTIFAYNRYTFWFDISVELAECLLLKQTIKIFWPIYKKIGEFVTFHKILYSYRRTANLLKYLQKVVLSEKC